MTNTHRVPAGVPTGGQFADQNRPESEINLTENFPPAPRVYAHFQPQFWDANDYAQDAGLAKSIDVTGIIAEMTQEDRDELEDGDDSTDRLYFEAVRRGLVDEHNGPFYVHVRTSVDAWDAHQLLTQHTESYTGDTEGLNDDQFAALRRLNETIGAKPAVEIHGGTLHVRYAEESEESEINWLGKVTGPLEGVVD